MLIYRKHLKHRGLQSQQYRLFSQMLHFSLLLCIQTFYEILQHEIYIDIIKSGVFFLNPASRMVLCTHSSMVSFPEGNTWAHLLKVLVSETIFRQIATHELKTEVPTLARISHHRMPTRHMSHDGKQRFFTVWPHQEEKITNGPWTNKSTLPTINLSFRSTRRHGKEVSRIKYSWSSKVQCDLRIISTPLPSGPKVLHLLQVRAH